MLRGERLSFAEEARGLYGVDLEGLLHPLSHYDPILARIERLVPGDGPLADRVEAFLARFTIPRERLDAVMRAAIAECRRRTIANIPLPQGEAFALEFVTNQPWSGYNWYQGNYRSRIQINTDQPVRLSRAVDLGCHEGYPGHHAYNMLLEQNLARRLGLDRVPGLSALQPAELHRRRQRQLRHRARLPRRPAAAVRDAHALSARRPPDAGRARPISRCCRRSTP